MWVRVRLVARIGYEIRKLRRYRTIFWRRRNHGHQLLPGNGVTVVGNDECVLSSQERIAWVSGCWFIDEKHREAVRPVGDCRSVETPCKVVGQYRTYSLIVNRVT